MRGEDTRRDDINARQASNGKTHRENNGIKGDDETIANERSERAARNTGNTSKPHRTPANGKQA